MKFMTPKKIALATSMALALSVAGNAFAAPAKATSASAEAVASVDLKMKLKSLYPDTVINDVAPAPVKGLYEVVMGKQLAYTDAAGEMFIFGKIYDMKNQKDLTSPRLAELNKIDLKQLNKANAIKTVKGKGTRTLFVFSDPDCPYCKRLEQTLRDVEDVTIYTFLYPLEGLHPNARAVAESIWCSKDKAKAWSDYMLREVTPKTATCKNPVGENIALAQKLGIGGTPALINGNGILTAGALPLAQLNDFLNK